MTLGHSWHLKRKVFLVTSSVPLALDSMELPMLIGYGLIGYGLTTP
jgi:hypothetical protein